MYLHAFVCPVLRDDDMYATLARLLGPGYVPAMHSLLLGGSPAMALEPNGRSTARATGVLLALGAMNALRP